jgi:hypothetical protein
MQKILFIYLLSKPIYLSLNFLTKISASVSEGFSISKKNSFLKYV